MYREDYIWSLTLNEEQQNKLTRFDTDAEAQLVDASLTHKKELITNYVFAEKNNGKKMLHTILGFFAKANEKSDEKTNVIINDEFTSLLTTSAVGKVSVHRP